MPRIDLIQLRGGTAAEWSSVNPVLAKNEKGIEEDTLKEKIGDGVTAWNDLPYASGGDAGTVVSKPGTTIQFNESAFYNKDTFLTSGNLTLDLTDAVEGRTVWVYCDKYVPEIDGADYLLTGNISSSNLNILLCTYDGVYVQISVLPKEYIATPNPTLSPGDGQIEVSNFSVQRADTYTIKFNTINDESTATEVTGYNGTDDTFTITGLTNDQEYFVFVSATGKGYLPSATQSKSATPLNSFIFNVQATDSQFTLPLVSSGNYNFDIYVDGVLGDNITVYNQAETTIALGDTNSHKIELRGQIEGWSFSANSEKDKIYDIENWGTLRMSGTASSSRWFDGCTNLTVSATDSPDFTNSTSGFYMFRNCSSLISIPSAGSWDLSNFTTLQGMFQSAALFNMNLNGLTTSNLCTNYRSMFQDASQFNSNLLGLDFSGSVNLSSMFRGAINFNGQLNWAQVGNAVSGAFGTMFLDGDSFDQDISAMVFNSNTKTTGNFILNNNGAFSTANYDAFLIALESQVAASGGVLDNGSIRIDANYTLGGAAQTAHDNLINTYGWTLTNSGGI